MLMPTLVHRQLAGPKDSPGLIHLPSWQARVCLPSTFPQVKYVWRALPSTVQYSSFEAPQDPTYLLPELTEKTILHATMLLHPPKHISELLHQCQ